MGSTVPPNEIPLPPSDFEHFDLPLIAVTQALVRVHRVVQDPLYFGRTGRHRWDDPEHRYGVLYASFDAEGAFVETFLADAPEKISSVGGGTIPVSGADLDTYGLSEIHISESVQAVDLRAGGAVAIGATGAIATGPHAVSQVWGRAIFTHAQRPGAIISPAKMDLSRVTVAVHERVQPQLSATFLGPLSGLPDIMERIAAAYPIVIIR